MRLGGRRAGPAGVQVVVLALRDRDELVVDLGRDAGGGRRGGVRSSSGGCRRPRVRTAASSRLRLADHPKQLTLAPPAGDRPARRGRRRDEARARARRRLPGLEKPRDDAARALLAAAAVPLGDDALRRGLALHVVRGCADGVGPLVDGALARAEDVEEVAVELAVQPVAAVTLWGERGGERVSVICLRRRV